MRSFAMPQLYGAAICCPIYRYGAKAGTLSGCGQTEVRRLQSLSGADVGYECVRCGIRFQDQDVNVDRSISSDPGSRAAQAARIANGRYVR
jgi:hypothetical protein